MRAIERGEILGLAEYEDVRERFRSRVIAEKKARRVAVGPNASAVFENRDTVLLQIQEMLRTERITRPGAVQHEIDTYNELLPGAGRAVGHAHDRGRRTRPSATRCSRPPGAGLERHLWLVAGDRRVAARSIDRGGDASRTTAVHYLKFTLGPALAEALRGATTPFAIVVDHPAYQATAALPAETILRARGGSRGVSGPSLHLHHVRFDEIDAAGIVYFARYFVWCHDAMESALAPVDGGYPGLVLRRRRGFPAVHVEADYAAPLRFGDDARVALGVERIGTSSVHLRFELARAADGQRVATVRHVVVLTDLDAMKSRPLPDDVRAVLEGLGAAP